MTTLIKFIEIFVPALILAWLIFRPVLAIYCKSPAIPSPHQRPDITVPKWAMTSLASKNLSLAMKVNVEAGSNGMTDALCGRSERYLEQIGDGE